MKKIGLLILMLVSIFVLVGCGQSDIRNVESIKKEDIFNQKEDRYFVYFHRVGCADCANAEPGVVQYATLLKEEDGCEGKRKIYSVLLYTPSEKPKDDIHIYREYTDSGGQGTDGKYFVNGVTNWEDLYIASTSSLIAINTRTDGERVASYIAQGANDVVSQLSTHLGECYSK